jgi:hypothetical protein
MKSHLVLGGGIINMYSLMTLGPYLGFFYEGCGLFSLCVENKLVV